MTTLNLKSNFDGIFNLETGHRVALSNQKLYFKNGNETHYIGGLYSLTEKKIEKLAYAFCTEFGISEMEIFTRELGDSNEENILNTITFKA